MKERQFLGPTRGRWHLTSAGQIRSISANSAPSAAPFILPSHWRLRYTAPAGSTSRCFRNSSAPTFPLHSGVVSMQSKEDEEGAAGNVRVAVRVRPLSHTEVETDSRFVVSHPAKSMVKIGDGSGDKTFTFDHVFPAHVSQKGRSACALKGSPQLRV